MTIFKREIIFLKKNLKNLAFGFHILFQNSAEHSSSSEVDEGPAAKLARFTNDLIAENHQRISINTNQSKRKFYELSDDNASDDDVSDL